MKCRSCLLLNGRATRLEFNWADPCKRVMMSFLDQGSAGWPSKISTHLTQGFRGSASQEAQQLRGLDQTSWLELGQWSRMRHPLRLTRRVSFVGTRRLRRSSWTTTIAPTTSFRRHIQSSVWIRMMACFQMVSTVWFQSSRGHVSDLRIAERLLDLLDEGREDQGCEVVPVQSQDARCAVHGIISALDDHLHWDAGPLVCTFSTRRHLVVCWVE